MVLRIAGRIRDRQSSNALCLHWRCCKHQPSCERFHQGALKFEGVLGSSRRKRRARDWSDSSAYFDFDKEEDERENDDIEYKETEAPAEVPNAYQITWVVHQLQRAIVEFLISTTNQKLITATRALAAKLRTSTLCNSLPKQNKKNDQATCWSSTSRIIKSVLNLESFCIERQDLVKGEFWFISHIILLNIDIFHRNQAWSFLLDFEECSRESATYWSR